MAMELNQINPYNNLLLKSPIILEGNICVIIGKNGAGKTRLLNGIKEQRIEVLIDGEIISTGQINYFNMESIQPRLEFGFDRIRFREEIRAAVSMYENNRQSFLLNKEEFQRNFSSYGRGNGYLNTLAIYDSVQKIANKKGVKPNEICSEDIPLYYTNIVNSLGTQNVTATFLQYLDRLEENESNSALNQVKGYNLPEYTDEQFEEIYGPPPWHLFNSVIKDILGGEYYVPAPKTRSHENYEAKLFKVKDDVEINQQLLSSGEKVLLWLAISVYNISIFAINHQKSKIILFDEPDAFLHPQMIEKMYITFNKIIETYGCKIIFTTHSPTTVALFQGEGIYQVSETSLDKIEKDIAISELLDGVSQVSVSYSNKRQVYVESHNDVRIYQEIFDFLRIKRMIKPYITLSFIPSGNKLPDELIKDKLRIVFGGLDSQKVSDFVNQVQGVGNCDRVIGTVEELVNTGCDTVFGVIDWDLKNRDNSKVFVSSPGIFYNIESVILNPLTIGLYILQNYRDRIKPNDFGVELDFNFSELYFNEAICQVIADSVSERVIKSKGVSRVTCEFANGIKINFDKEYVHMKGHELEMRIKKVFPFLKEHSKNDLVLKLDVTKKTMLWGTDGKNIPKPLIILINKLQA